MPQITDFMANDMIYYHNHAALPQGYRFYSPRHDGHLPTQVGWGNVITCTGQKIRTTIHYLLPQILNEICAFQRLGKIYRVIFKDNVWMGPAALPQYLFVGDWSWTQKRITNYFFLTLGDRINAVDVYCGTMYVASDKSTLVMPVTVLDHTNDDPASFQGFRFNGDREFLQLPGWGVVIQVKRNAIRMATLADWLHHSPRRGTSRVRPDDSNSPVYHWAEFPEDVPATGSFSVITTGDPYMQITSWLKKQYDLGGSTVPRWDVFEQLYGN